jgi:glycosyltransferase involved in cell wall biosynthesis
MTFLRQFITGARWLSPARVLRRQLRLLIGLVYRRVRRDAFAFGRRCRRKLLSRNRMIGRIKHEPHERLDRPLRVLLGSHNLHWEGAPRSLLEIACGLNRDAHLTVEVLAPCDGPLRAQYQEAGIPVTVREFVRCPNVVQGWLSANDYKATLTAIEDVIDRTHPDVVVANTLHSFYLVEAATRAGIPALWIIRESYSMDAMKAAINDFAFEDCRRAFEKAYRVVFVSADTRRLFESFETRSNFLTLPKALPIREYDEYCARNHSMQAREAIGADPQRKIILTLGTVCERKDQMTLVRAVAILHKKRHDFRCYIVGVREELAYTREIRKLAHELGVEGEIRFIAEIADVKPYLRAADVFAFTSHGEAASRVLLEAQMFGLPIVTTRCGGTLEIVRPDVNALLFPFSDALALAAHLENLLDDDEIRASMARASRHVFDALLSYEEMIACYRRLLRQAWMYA